MPRAVKRPGPSSAFSFATVRGDDFILGRHRDEVEVHIHPWHLLAQASLVQLVPAPHTRPRMSMLDKVFKTYTIPEKNVERECCAIAGAAEALVTLYIVQDLEFAQ